MYAVLKIQFIPSHSFMVCKPTKKNRKKSLKNKTKTVKYAQEVDLDDEEYEENKPTKKNKKRKIRNQKNKNQNSRSQNAENQHTENQQQKEENLKISIKEIDSPQSNSNNQTTNTELINKDKISDNQNIEKTIPVDKKNTEEVYEETPIETGILINIFIGLFLNSYHQHGKSYVMDIILVCFNISTLYLITQKTLEFQGIFISSIIILGLGLLTQYMVHKRNPQTHQSAFKWMKEISKISSSLFIFGITICLCSFSDLRINFKDIVILVLSSISFGLFISFAGIISNKIYNSATSSSNP